MSHEQQHLFDLYFEYVSKTEPPTIYNRWSLITSIGALLGRKFWMPFGANRIFPNKYVMLIGDAGTRKSTAIKTAAKILRTAGYEQFAAEKTTKEKFLLDLEGAEDESANYRDYRKGSQRTVSPRDVLANLELGESSGNHDGIPREVFITADEFNEFAGSGNLDFLSMLGALWDWDNESSTYKHRFKNSKSISIYQPTISLISGNTHTGFKNAFPEAAIGQGFLSRLILVYSEPSGRKITFPEKPSESIAIAIGEQLNKIRKDVTGEATLTLKARQALDTIYRTWQELEDYRFKSYSTRRQTHLYKLCLITCAMRISTEIDLQDVILANTILTWTETSMDKALGEYGKSKNSEVIQNIMAALYSAKEPMKMGELYKLVRRDLDRQELLPGILNDLVAAGKVQYIKETGAFAPLQRSPNSAARYVDFTLLKESRE